MLFSSHIKFFLIGYLLNCIPPISESCFNWSLCIADSLLFELEVYPSMIHRYLNRNHTRQRRCNILIEQSIEIPPFLRRYRKYLFLFNQLFVLFFILLCKSRGNSMNVFPCICFFFFGYFSLCFYSSNLFLNISEVIRLSVFFFLFFFNISTW